MSTEVGVLYIVATPIGNLGDLSTRAVEVLQRADYIAAEDTRHSSVLLRRFSINTPLLSLHEHNEREKSEILLQRLLRGELLALISDAGTPLISDPGYHLVREAQKSGVRVVPIPGASALLTALCGAGLPTDRFCFEGFLPSKAEARRKRLATLRDEPRTLIFYEAPHRLLESLREMVAIFGAEREAVVARELTKMFETIRRATLGELCSWIEGEAEQRQGEFVLLLRGAVTSDGEREEAESRRIAELLAEELPLKQAAILAARISGGKRNSLYRYLLQHRGN